MTCEQVPRHIAIVMDGNGRWAKKRFLPRIAGHRQGVESLKRCLRACEAKGVQVLTVFAFSSENWKRPSEEVSALMNLFVMALSSEVSQLKANGVQLRFVGDRQGLSPKVLRCMQEGVNATAGNNRLILNACFNYGGRWDIAQAARKLVEQGLPITEANLNAAMALAHVPDPDLLIRTGGEHRMSNFLLWQSAYSEFFFTDVLWPDFNEATLELAIAEFAQRERRFGMLSNQLEGEPVPAAAP